MNINPLDPSMLILAVVVTGIVFVIIALLTRAPWRRIVGVLLSSIPVVLVVRVFDQLAAQQGLWRYPTITTAEAPLAWYIAAALFYGASLGLIGWRVARRFGWIGFIIFLLIFGFFGVGRDYFYSVTTGLIQFGTGWLPYLADWFAYISNAILVQLLMYLIVGPPNSDRLARSS